MGWSKCSSNDSRKLRAATSAPAPAKTVARRLPFLLSFSDCPSPVAYRLIVHCHRQWIARVNFSTILRHAKSIIAILTICVRLSASSSCYRLRHVHARCNCACTDSVHPITRFICLYSCMLIFSWDRGTIGMVSKIRHVCCDSTLLQLCMYTQHTVSRFENFAIEAKQRRSVWTQAQIKWIGFWGALFTLMHSVCP